jgi:hypothetical protein
METSRQDRRRRQSMGKVSPPSNYVGTSVQISYSRLRAPKEMAQPTGAEPVLEGVLCAQRLKKVLMVTVRLSPI